MAGRTLSVDEASIRPVRRAHAAQDADARSSRLPISIGVDLRQRQITRLVAGKLADRESLRAAPNANLCIEDEASVTEPDECMHQARNPHGGVITQHLIDRDGKIR
jgi:hypothetical protein